jgi:hypothetical protein
VKEEAEMDEETIQRKVTDAAADAWLLVEVVGDTVRITGAGLSATLGDGGRSLDPGAAGPIELPVDQAERIVVMPPASAAPPTTPIALGDLADLAVDPVLVREPGSYPGSLQTVKIDARVPAVRPVQSTRGGASAGEQAAGSSDGRMRAALCPSGHVNPPERSHCRLCGAAVGPELVDVESPILGRVVAPDGRAVPLLGTVLVGRSPSGAAGEATLTVPSRLGDVSRTHVELRASGWTVFARDVSRNGTILRRPGVAPTRLAPGEPTALAAGDQLDLGDGVALRLEDLP